MQTEVVDALIAFATVTDVVTGPHAVACVHVEGDAEPLVRTLLLGTVRARAVTFRLRCIAHQTRAAVSVDETCIPDDSLAGGHREGQSQHEEAVFKQWSHATNASTPPTKVQPYRTTIPAD